jgi:hypothetical protein
MKVFKLLERARKRLQQNDTLYQEQVDTVLGILRSSGVLPYKRSSLNGHIHKLVAIMIVDELITQMQPLTWLPVILPEISGVHS